MDRSADARLAGPAVVAWAVAALMLGISAGRAMVVGIGLLTIGLALLSRGRRRWAAIVLAAAAAGLAAGLRLTAADAGPVPDLAAEAAVVDVTVTLTSDPIVRAGRFGDIVVAEARTVEISGRGSSARVRSPVLIVGDDEWQDLPLGAAVRTIGRLKPSDDRRHAAILLPTRIVEVVDEPAWWWRLSSHLRAGITEGVAAAPADERALVPALVDGDVRAISDELAEAFRDCGLTHLLAVSGTNLTLVLAFVLTIARWMGVRGYPQIGVAIVATAGFIVLARPDPSVLRSAAMGLVAIAGLGAGGRKRGVRALSIAVLALVLVDPWLARSAGFALSVMATGGILLLTPAWTRALASWMPRLLAEAVAVPLAAQLACTPVIALISGQVSLVAVVANLLAAPAVGPATVLGLVAGLVALVWEGPAHLIGWGAAGMAWWIIEIAERGSALPGASVGWSSDRSAVAVLVVVCVGIGVALTRLLWHRLAVIGGVVVLGLWIVQPSAPGWPPDEWIMVACDVGQGDALALNAGDGAAVVVDTGPEPALVDRCLDGLDVEVIPLVVLTHPHADHIGGIDGVGDGRPVGAVAVGPGASELPDYGSIVDWTDAHGIPLRELSTASTGSVGDLAWTVLGPDPTLVGAEDSTFNDASVVLSVRIRGISALLTGDIEEPAQRALSAVDPTMLRADVVKVPHHGSADGDPDFLRTVAARLAVISVGADNSYGHPAPATLEALRAGGATIARTDESGDLAVVLRDGNLSVVTR